MLQHHTPKVTLRRARVASTSRCLILGSLKEGNYLGLLADICTSFQKQLQKLLGSLRAKWSVKQFMIYIYTILGLEQDMVFDPKFSVHFVSSSFLPPAVVSRWKLEN